MARSPKFSHTRVQFLFGSVETPLSFFFKRRGPPTTMLMIMMTKHTKALRCKNEQQNSCSKEFFLSFASRVFQNKEKEEEQLPWHSVAVKHNATKTTNDNKIGMSMTTHMTFFCANLNCHSGIYLMKK